MVPITHDNPKFIRDTLNTKDIIGSSPKKRNIWQIRQNEKNFNIKKSLIVKDKIPNYNYIDYADVAKFRFKSGRKVNPLDPVYDVKFNNEPIGQIDKSKPNPLYKLIYSDPSNLKTNDIKGAQIGTKNKINKFSNNETNNLIVSDIPGTSVGSLKNCIVTNRHVNPVCPEYTMPGYSNLGSHFNPFGENPESINKNLQNQNKDKNNFINEKEILEEMNEVSKAYLTERKAADKRPLSHLGYSYSKKIIGNNEFASGGSKKENDNDKLIDGEKNDSYNCKNLNANLNSNNKAADYKDGYNNSTKTNNNYNDQEKKKIYKRVDSNKNIHYEGKENLKENEQVGFNDQIYTIPK